MHDIILLPHRLCRTDLAPNNCTWLQELCRRRQALHVGHVHLVVRAELRRRPSRPIESIEQAVSERRCTAACQKYEAARCVSGPVSSGRSSFVSRSLHASDSPATGGVSLRHTSTMAARIRTFKRDEWRERHKSL